MSIVVVALCVEMGPTNWLQHMGWKLARDPRDPRDPEGASTTHPSSSIYLLVLSPGHGTCTYMKTDWFQSLDGWPLSLSLSQMLIKMVSIYTTNLSVSQSILISLFPLIDNVAWALDSFVSWNYVLPCNKNYEQNEFFFQNQNSQVHQENFLTNLAIKLFSHTILCSNES